ncbi:hypothetical protein JCM8097_000525 [Rhodosporidiobolus ruineniae]
MPHATIDSTVPAIGINGFGRIGRAVFRASLDRDDLQVVHINHTAPTTKHLLRSILFDSTHGPLRHSADLSASDSGDALYFRGRRITLSSTRDPSQLNWAEYGAEYVVESTGKMLTVESASQHLQSGAKKVVISAPSKDAKTIVVGVNRKEYSPEMNVVSNASCTTNCLAPLAKVLHNAFGISSGMMSTVHASTSSQHILDGYSKKSLRLGRSVASNIIPTTTGAASAISLVLPELTGKLTGISIRVPVSNVSMVDLTVVLTKPVATKEELLQPLRDAAAGRMKSSIGPLSNVIAVSDDELVSSDFCGWQQSCIVDSAATTKLDDKTWKIIAWYDNEWAYSVRILDLIEYMASVDRGVESPADQVKGPVNPASLAAAVEAAV